MADGSKGALPVLPMSFYEGKDCNIDSVEVLEEVEESRVQAVIDQNAFGPEGLQWTRIQNRWKQTPAGLFVLSYGLPFDCYTLKIHQHSVDYSLYTFCLQ